MLTQCFMWFDSPKASTVGPMTFCHASNATIFLLLVNLTEVEKPLTKPCTKEGKKNYN